VSSSVNLKLMRLVDICKTAIPWVKFDFHTLKVTAALPDNFPSISAQFSC